jgi:dihydrofolate synthase/folylpolyglutamate synthase
MDYQESLDYLFGLQRFGIKLGLENIRALLEHLDHPEQSYEILHVGGTNGKGSVSACLAEIVRRAGYRVGLYTSPHLHSFTERIRVNGVAVAQHELARLTQELSVLAGEIPATFFEFTTALALLYFHRQKVDFAVLEVGMGGRLDATNAVTPRLSIITSICRDHAEHLGEDLSSIAREKGGIIKEGVPVVIARQEPEALGVLQEQARCRQAPVFLFGRDFKATAKPGGLFFEGIDLQLIHLRPGLSGVHQHENLALALAAAELLRREGVFLPLSALRDGVQQVRWPGRLEWWRGERKVLLDGAHNEGSAKALAGYLASLETTGVRWVVGIKGDKRVPDILNPILPLVTSLYCTAPPVEKPALPVELVQKGSAAGVASRIFATPAEALTAALKDRREGEIVLVAGSLFLVAIAREMLMSQGSANL